MKITIEDVEMATVIEFRVAVYQNMEEQTPFEWWVCQASEGCSERSCVAKFRTRGEADGYAHVVNKWCDAIDAGYESYKRRYARR